LQKELVEHGSPHLPAAALRDAPDPGGGVDAGEIDRLHGACRPDQVDGMPLMVDVEALRPGHRALQPLGPVDQLEDDVEAKILAGPLTDRIEQELPAAENPQTDLRFARQAAAPFSECASDTARSRARRTSTTP